MIFYFIQLCFAVFQKELDQILIYLFFDKEKSFFYLFLKAINCD